MQRFIAELSSLVDKTEFEKSWNSEPPSNRPKVEFAFTGQRISAVVHSEIESQWPSANFHQAVSAAIRRTNALCNVRWL